MDAAISNEIIYHEASKFHDRSCNVRHRLRGSRNPVPRRRLEEDRVQRMAWHAVVMLAWGAAARGAEIGDAEFGDADSARAARIELLQEENAKVMRTLEKVRGAISYWKTLGFVPDAVGGASSAEDEGPAVGAESAGAPGPGRRLESKVPGGVKVWHEHPVTQLCRWSRLWGL